MKTRDILTAAIVSLMTLTLSSCDQIESMRYHLDNMFKSSSDEPAETSEPTEIQTVSVSEAEASEEPVFSDDPGEEGFQNRRFTGKLGGKYEIVAILSLENGVMSGKYAYKSTLDKYGDSDESYMYLTQRQEGPDFLEYILTASTYRSEEPIEVWDVTGDEASISGTVTILSSGKELSVELE